MAQLAENLWVSPWRQRMIDGNLVHVCDVARSKAESLEERIEVAITDDELGRIPLDERRHYLAQEIVAAAGILGVVKGEQQPAEI